MPEFSWEKDSEPSKGKFSWEKDTPSKRESKFSWEDSKGSSDDSLLGSLKAFGKSAVEAIPGAAGGTAGAIGAMAAAAPLAAAAGPAAPLVEIGAALVGGFAGGAAGSKAGEIAGSFVDEPTKKSIGFDKKTREKETKEHPYASFAGELAPNLAFFRPGSVSKTERAIGAALGGGIEAGQELVDEGKIDPTKVAMATAFQAGAPKATKITQALETKLGLTAAREARGWGKVEAEADKHRTEYIESTLKGFADESVDPVKIERMKQWDAAKEQHGRRAADQLIPPDASTSEPGEQRKIGRTTEEVGVRDPQMAREQEARRLFHVKGPEAAKAFLERTTKPTSAIINELKDAIGININAKMADEHLVHNKTMDMKEMVPELADREAVSLAMESGNISGLTEQQQKLAGLWDKERTEIGQRAHKAGVLKNFIENYVTHIAKEANIPKDEQAGFIANILKAAGASDDVRTGSRFAQERTHDTIQAMEEALKKSGKVAEKDIAEIYNAYASSMLKAIEDKKLMDTMKVTKIGTDYALIDGSKGGYIPSNYEMIERGQFRGWFVHPDIKPALDFVMEAREPGMMMQAALTVNAAVKRSNIFASFFHAKSLAEAAMLAHSYKRQVKALMKDPNFEALSINKVLEQFRKGGLGSQTDDWVRKGGMVLGGGKGVEDVSQTALKDLGRMADKLIAKFGPDGNWAEKGVGLFEKYTTDKIDKFTWQYLHDGFKLVIAEQKLQQAMIDHPHISRETHMKEISRFVNNSFGGLNWYDIARQSTSKFQERLSMAAYSPEGRRALQMMLFAPDWTVSTLRAFTTALPKSMDIVGGVKGMMKPATQADHARLYQMKFALMYLTLLNGINMMTAGRPIWDNKDPTRIEMKDGTSIQATKHAMEPFHLVMDTDKAVANKLGFFPKALVIGVGGVEYASPTAPKLEDQSLLGRIGAISKGALPFQAQAMEQASTVQEGLTKAALGTLGVPVYGQTAEEKAKKRAEKRERLMKKRIKEFQDKGYLTKD